MWVRVCESPAGLFSFSGMCGVFFLCLLLVSARGPHLSGTCVLCGSSKSVLSADAFVLCLSKPCRVTSLLAGARFLLAFAPSPLSGAAVPPFWLLCRRLVGAWTACSKLAPTAGRRSPFVMSWMTRSPRVCSWFLLCPRSLYRIFHLSCPWPRFVLFYPSSGGLLGYILSSLFALRALCCP